MKRSGMQPVARRTSSGRIHSPTRERILELVGNADQGLALSAIAATTGLHENTVRAHLEALLEDGYLLRKAAEATGRGRPAWILVPGRDPRIHLCRLGLSLGRATGAQRR